MNNLATRESKSTIQSTEVAEMMNMKHYQILEKLEGTKTAKGIIPILNAHNFMVVDYFIKSSYTDTKGEERPCYNCTKMGCEFLANKFTGEKGILFTAKYVKRFNDMEQAIQAPRTIEDMIILQAESVKKLKADVTENAKKIDKLETDMFVTPRQMKELKKLRTKRVHDLIGKRGTKAYKDRSFRGKVYADISRQVNNYFNVSEYAYIPKVNYEEARDVFNNYNLSCELAMELKKLQSA